MITRLLGSVYLHNSIGLLQITCLLRKYLRANKLISLEFLCPFLLGLARVFYPNQNSTRRTKLQTQLFLFTTGHILRLLKGIKLEISTDFIWSDNKEVIITTNKIASTSDINIVEKYTKELKDVDLNNIMNPKLAQSKSYQNSRYFLLHWKH